VKKIFKNIFMHLSNNQYKQKLYLSLQLIPMVSYTSHEEPITIALPKVIAAVCRLDGNKLIMYVMQE